jgi:hypothetical protein
VERPTDHGRACRTLHFYGTAKREPSGSRVTARDSTAPHKLGWKDAHTFGEIPARLLRVSGTWHSILVAAEIPIIEHSRASKRFLPTDSIFALPQRVEGLAPSRFWPRDGAMTSKRDTRPQVKADLEQELGPAGPGLIGMRAARARCSRLRRRPSTWHIRSFRNTVVPSSCGGQGGGIGERRLHAAVRSRRPEPREAGALGPQMIGWPGRTPEGSASSERAVRTPRWGTRGVGHVHVWRTRIRWMMSCWMPVEEG